MDRAIEDGQVMDEETRATVSRLHTVLRPYLLRRLKADVEKQMPGKYEHIIYCRLSKRQRFLYDEFMSRAQTRDTLSSGNFLSIINCLMQLRKVCNHPDLFEVRPIVTSLALPRSIVTEYDVEETLIRRRLLSSTGVSTIPARFQVIGKENDSTIAASMRAQLDASVMLAEHLKPKPPKRLDAPINVRTAVGWKHYVKQQQYEEQVGRLSSMIALNAQRCHAKPTFGSERVATLSALVPDRFTGVIPSYSKNNTPREMHDALQRFVCSYSERADTLAESIAKFAFATPAVQARDMPSHALPGLEEIQVGEEFDEDTLDSLHLASTKLSIAFPDRSLIQYDCGKLQKLDELLRSLKEGSHRALIFTQMTKVLDILEIFLSFHGHRYLRLDGSTKVEQRQILTERFNTDSRILVFISSTRAGGLGINLTGADTVVFYDSDWNPCVAAYPL